MTTAAPAWLAVEGLLAAIASRRPQKIAERLTQDVTWANVPHPPAVGREAVVAMLESVIGRAERVSWDVVACAVSSDRVHLERLDRFWIDGREIAAPCHGVFRVDERGGRVAEVRDYVDLGPWREMLRSVLAGTE